MTALNTNSTAFDHTAVLSGQDGQGNLVIPKGQLRLHLPDHIKSVRTQTKISRTPITVYFAEAEHEETMIVGCSGFKHDEILNFDQIKRLNQQDVSVMWVALPNPGRESEFMDHFIHAATDMLLDPQHELIAKWMNRDVPKIFHGHSTGAQMFFHLMREPETFRKLTSEFSGAALSSTMLEYPMKMLHSAFHWHAQNHLGEIPEETAFGKLYLKLSSLSTLDFNDEEARQKYITAQSYIRPTYTQMLELERFGQIALEDIHDQTSNVRNRGDFPVMMLSGKNDWFANAKPQQKAASALGALHLLSKTSSHSPLTEDSQIFKNYQKGIAAMFNGNFNEFAAQFEPKSRFAFLRGNTPPPTQESAPQTAQLHNL